MQTQGKDGLLLFLSFHKWMFNYKYKFKKGMGFFCSFPSINRCLITNANSRIVQTLTPHNENKIHILESHNSLDSQHQVVVTLSCNNPFTHQSNTNLSFVPSLISWKSTFKPLQGLQ